MKIEYDKVPFAQGRQGKIFTVKAVSGVRCSDKVLKIYHGNDSKQRTRLIIDRINEKQLHMDPALECLPRHYYQLGGKTAIIMKKASGLDLEKSWKKLCKKPLAERMAILWQIMPAVRKLHEAGIVDGDIHTTNVMMYKNRVWIIDVDGGGIPDKKLNAVIRGHGGGSFMAPELFNDNTKMPLLSTDNWSLAVLSHEILVPGIDPFYFLDKYADINKLKEWPPRAVKPQYKEIARAQTLIGRACYPVFDLLKVTFNQGINHPSMRISPARFEHTLGECLTRMTICPACSEEIVVQEKCPFCNQHLSGVMLKVGTKEVSLNSNRIIFTMQDFGRQGDQPLATLESKKGIVFCNVTDDFPLLFNGKAVSENETIQISTELPRLIELSYSGVKLNLIIQKKDAVIRDMTRLIKNIKVVSNVSNPSPTLNHAAGKRTKTNIIDRLFRKIRRRP
jgi:serine/threonine protein kinase